MLTSTEISTLKNELIQMRKQALKTEESTKQDDNIKETSGELSMYDNHPGDMGTALFEREKDRTLNEKAESEINKIDSALEAIKNKTYGQCEVCNKSIPYERLLAVPYTTLCIEHAQELEQSVEQDTALNEIENPFSETQDPRAIDYENSFEEVAEFGTSDSPSDFTDPSKPTYMDDNEPESIIDQIIDKNSQVDDDYESE